MEFKNLRLIVITLLILTSITIVNAKDEEKYSVKLEIVKTLAEEQELKCEILLDDNKEKYKFSGRERKIISEEFDDTFNLTCDSQMKAIKMQIYNSKKTEVISKFYRQTSTINFELILNNAEIEISNQEEENIECSITYDKTTIKKTITEKSETIDIDFLKDIKYSCDKDLEESIMTIRDNNYNEIFFERIKNKNNQEYKLGDQTKKYEMNIFFGGEIKERLDCGITVDKKKTRYSFDKSTRLKDRLVTNQFSKEFKIFCSEDIEDLKISVLDVKTDKLLYRTIVENQKAYNFNEKNINNKIEPIVEEKKEIITNNTTQSEIKPVEKPKINKNPEIDGNKLKCYNNEQKEIECSTKINKVEQKKIEQQKEEIITKKQTPEEKEDKTKEVMLYIFAALILVGGIWIGISIYMNKNR